MSTSSSTLVCFPCRKHRSIERFPSPSRKRPDSENAYSCPGCAGDMHHIGHKLEVPKHDDAKGWEMFYDQLTAPGLGRWAAEIDGERARENAHWEGCLIRLKSSRNGGSVGGVGGCQRCAEVEKRMPKHGLGWMWNAVLR